MSHPVERDEDRALALAMLQIARRAGALIMKRYEQELDVMVKSDDSPVTIADQEANDLIVEALARLTPEILIIAEESVDEHQQALDLTAQPFWLVDPLDGTKEFINRNGDFTVNIALIREGTPTLGVVYLPTTQVAYLTLSSSEAVRISADDVHEPLRARPVDLDAPVVMVSRSHLSAETGEYLKRFAAPQTCARGSSLKLCLIASGDADLYPRHGRTMEWDIASGHAVLSAAGGKVITLDGAPLTYGKAGFENPHFIAAGITDQPLV